MIASFVAAAGARWQIHMDARRTAAEGLGESGAYETAAGSTGSGGLDPADDPRGRPRVRTRVDPVRTDLEFEMQNLPGARPSNTWRVPTGFLINRPRPSSGSQGKADMNRTITAAISGLV